MKRVSESTVAGFASLTGSICFLLLLPFWVNVGVTYSLLSYLFLFLRNQFVVINC